MKLKITGASVFAERFYQGAGQYQWVRETYKNSEEANAEHVHFGIEWEAVEKLGVYRRIIADDGHGMDATKLVEYFSTLGAGDKKIGGVHDNFGIGAKIALLPWNPRGLVVLSWKNNKGSMIWIVQNGKEYELKEFQTENGASVVIDPDDDELEDTGDLTDWSKVREKLNDVARTTNIRRERGEFITDHGTIFVLLGSDTQPDTVLGNPAKGEEGIKGITLYLNSRFEKFDNVKVTVAELRGDKKNAWPEGIEDKSARRPNNRAAQGAAYFLKEIEGEASGVGKPGPSDAILLDEDRVIAEWHLWDGKRPTIHAYAKEKGYVAVRYKDELYELRGDKHTFRRFGIVEPEVMERLTIILEPPLFDPAGDRWGVHPDQSRNRLIFSGDGDSGVAIPLDTWGEEFADNLPTPIIEAIKAARGNQESTTLDDPEYRRRLAQKFGKRWQIPIMVKATPEDLGERVPAQLTGETIKVRAQRKKTRTKTRKRTRAAVTNQGTHPGQPNGTRPEPTVEKKEDYLARSKQERELVAAAPDGTEQGVLLAEERAIPDIKFTSNAVMFDQPWHLALWRRHEASNGNKPTVYINTASPILEDVVSYHAARYAPHLTGNVRETIYKVFGEVAACKIAHAQKLTFGPNAITEQDLDDAYLDEKALTTGLMGLLAEESLITQRLGALGPKKQQTERPQESSATA